MDNTIEQLVDFAMRAEYSALDEATVHVCKQHLIDTFASAMGAYDEPLSGMARAIAARYAGPTSATVWGSDMRTVPEAAAFANGVMLRFLDISDTHLGRGGGHPSDVLSAIIAVGESVGAGGAAVINSMVLAYDVYCSLNDAVDINGKGWDQPLLAVLGSVLGVGKLLNLSRGQLGNAVSLAVTPNMALRETRHGDLSSWKGCAGANAARNAVFAAMLAQEGFTGPGAAFEGKAGLWNVLGRFDWPLPAGPGATHHIHRTHMKSLPICYHGQAAALCAFDMRPRLRLEDISEIHVEAYRSAVNMMGNDATRWAPASRETADHSMPYVIAIALLDGEITTHSFATERLTDPAVVNLMRKVKVSESADFTMQFPEAAPSRVTIRMSSGEVIAREIKYPQGHAKNPMDDAQVEAKFHALFAGRAGAGQRDELLQTLWRFERVADVGKDVIRLLAKR